MGPTTALINERAQSEAEAAGQWLKAANGTMFIGSPTVGANGIARIVVLPGNVRVQYTGDDARLAGGGQLQRVGLQPDLRVTPTIAGVRAGRDEVLEAALVYLRNLEP